MRFVLVLMLILSAGGLHAGDAETIARIEAAWAGWGDKVGDLVKIGRAHV